VGVALETRKSRRLGAVVKYDDCIVDVLVLRL
jgi:hypothetical protein